MTHRIILFIFTLLIGNSAIQASQDVSLETVLKQGETAVQKRLSSIPSTSAGEAQAFLIKERFRRLVDETEEKYFQEIQVFPRSAFRKFSLTELPEEVLARVGTESFNKTMASVLATVDKVYQGATPLETRHKEELALFFRRH